MNRLRNQQLLLLTSIVIFGVLAFFSLPGSIQAAEGQCHLKHCLVPAPTVVVPGQNQLISEPPAYIRGLTWKTTVVKVFLDGQELTQVEQRKHEDYYASFFATLPADLKPGRHFVYTIAYSEKPGWYDQSIESTYHYFEIKPKISLNLPKVTTSTKSDTESPDGKVGQNPILKPEAAPKTGEVEREVSSSSSSEKLATSDDLTFGQLKKDVGQSFSGWLSGLNKREKNRLFGLIILALIIIIIMLQKLIRRYRRQKDFLPPPPEPPKI